MTGHSAHPGAPPGGIHPGDIIARTLRLYRAHAGLLVAIGAAVFVPLGVARAALGTVGWPGLAVATVANLAAIFLVQGAIVWAIERLREADAPAPALGDVLRASPDWFGRLAVASTLAALGVLTGLALLVVPGLVLLTWWLVLSPVVVIERRAVGESFGRSRRLVSGHAWPVFTVALLTMLIQLGLSIALQLATMPVGDAAAEFVAVAVGNTVAAPLVAAAWTLTYYDLRALAPGE